VDSLGNRGVIESLPMEVPSKLNEEQFDISIAYDGTWHHQGAPMTRMPLVRLFSSVLKRDAAGDYWLMTPVEKGRIAVADAPFVVTGWRMESRGEGQDIHLTDNLGRETPMDAGHTLVLRVPQTGGDVKVPYHQLGGGVEARVGTAVYYDLVHLGLEQGQPDADGYLHIRSSGVLHPLGAG